jgi:hypothetical protein
MRRHTTLSLAISLGLLAIVSTAPTLLAKQEERVIYQDEESLLSEDITVNASDDPNQKGEKLQAFDVGFAAHAYIPERTYPESMLVKVQTGTFAFRVQSEVLVDPEAADIEVLEANPPIPLGSNPNKDHAGRTFDPVGTVQNCSGTPPHVLCLLDPDVLGENFVQLEAGDLVYLPDNSTCFFCNTTELDAGATLLVWAPATGFSWYEMDQAGLSTGFDSTVAVDQGLRTIRGWMFNPGSRCN